ncbi:MAG: hypothetical protein ACR2G2_12375 [Pseudonocardia sp.]
MLAPKAYTTKIDTVEIGAVEALEFLDDGRIQAVAMVVTPRP